MRSKIRQGAEKNKGRGRPRPSFHEPVVRNAPSRPECRPRTPNGKSADPAPKHGTAFRRTESPPCEPDGRKNRTRNRKSRPGSTGRLLSDDSDGTGESVLFYFSKLPRRESFRRVYLGYAPFCRPRTSRYKRPASSRNVSCRATYRGSSRYRSRFRTCRPPHQSAHPRIFAAKVPQETPDGNALALYQRRAGFGHRPFLYAPDILCPERRTENRHDTSRNRIRFFIV